MPPNPAKCRPIRALSGLMAGLHLLFCSNESDHVKYVSVVCLSLAEQVMPVLRRGYWVGERVNLPAVRRDCFA